MTPALHAPASPRPPIALLAVAAGAIVANLYYAQPLLPAIRASLHASEGAIGAIPVVTQLGYGAGMLTLVPLGDRLERRAIIVAMTSLSAIVLLGVALAPTAAALVALSFALGLASMVPQVIVPYAATAAPEHERGRVVGTVMAGLLVGILLSRTVSGFLGSALGWRAVYFFAAGVMALLAVVLFLRLPPQRPEARVPLGELYASLGRLVRGEPVLRLHALLGAMTFGAFSVFWSTLAFHLAALPAHYGSATVGAFGLVGVAGALAAPLVGRLADKRDPRIVNLTAIVVVLGSFAVFAAFGASLAGLAVGVTLLDVGVQSNHIANQARIFALAPSLRSRINTVYMTAYFAGGALGSWLGVLGFSHGGWIGACEFGAAMTGVALVAYGVSARSTQAASHASLG